MVLYGRFLWVVCLFCICVGLGLLPLLLYLLCLAFSVLFVICSMLALVGFDLLL